MTTWHEYVQQHNLAPEWPYPIRYGSERRMDADVLVLGGGIAGCHAAISARKRGARVVVLEKGATKWSGNGGAGVDHWLSACTNPCSQVTPEAFAERAMADSQVKGSICFRSYSMGLSSASCCRSPLARSFCSS